MQHSPEISLEKLRSEVMGKIVHDVIPAQYMDDKTVVHINPCGDFIIGGPQVLGILYNSDFALHVSHTSYMPLIKVGRNLWIKKELGWF